MIYTLVYHTLDRQRIGMPGITEDRMRDPNCNPLGVRVARWDGGRWRAVSEEWYLAQTPDIHPVDFDFAVEVEVPWGRDVVMARDIDPALVEA